ncbi:MAG: glucan 1,3-beta-glucosidase [Candidatus Saccharibacteria bacterium]|nr:glucan 1,3-beta-glucosidase [Candidatus Saccharibacteria bacterium]
MAGPLRGVNLGGWLVLEPWLTPSLFANSTATDEYTYCQQNQAAWRKLKQHRDTFITEKDFAWLAAHGIQAVRLPVGYWLFGDAAPYVETASYVDKAFAWAKKHQLKVLIDLHGAPGSQNGTMHSGQRGEVGWHKSPANIEQTLGVLTRIAERYGKHSALLGISLLNEPSSKIPTAVLEDFYIRAYNLLREHCPADAWMVFSDAFRPGRWHHKLARAKYPGIAIDHHHYQIYSWIDKRLPAHWQVWRTRYLLPFALRRIARQHPLIVGEWSLALGRGDKSQQAAYAHAQLAVFQTSAAWFYWTYKTEYGSIWSFRACYEQGLLPL